MFPNTNPMMMAMLGAGPAVAQKPQTYQEKIQQMMASGQYNPGAVQFLQENQTLLEQLYGSTNGSQKVADAVRKFAPAYSDSSPAGKLGKSIARRKAQNRLRPSRAQAVMDDPNADPWVKQFVGGMQQKIDSKVNDPNANAMTYGFNTPAANAGQTIQGSQGGRLLYQNPNTYNEDEMRQKADAFRQQQIAKGLDPSLITNITSRSPDAYGNMRDMPGVKIQSKRANLLESLQAEMDNNFHEGWKNHNDEQIDKIKGDMRREDLLSTANSRIRKNRRIAGQMGQDISGMTYLGKDASMDEIQAALSGGRNRGIELTQQRKEQMSKAMKERIAAEQQARQLASLPLREQMQIRADLRKEYIARQQFENQLKLAKINNKPAMQRNQLAEKQFEQSITDSLAENQRRQRELELREQELAGTQDFRKQQLGLEERQLTANAERQDAIAKQAQQQLLGDVLGAMMGSGDPRIMQQAQQGIQGLAEQLGLTQAPQQTAPQLPTPTGLAGGVTPGDAAVSKANLDQVAPGLSATAEKARTPDELRRTIRNIYPNVSIAEFHQLYQEALNVKLGNATAAERKKWNDQEKAWSRREAARAMGPILPPSSAYMTGGGSSFNDYPANGIGF